MIELTPHLDNEKKEPLYVQLYHYIREEIQTGNIAPGVKLPSKRKLAAHLGISQNTIETAYQQLNAEGYVKSELRKGVYVKKLAGDLYPYSSRISFHNKKVTKNHDEQYKFDFSHGKVDLEHFPYSTWRKLTVQSLYEENSEIFFNGDPKGDTNLREEIAQYVFQSRGVTCSPEQIMIGAGTQYLLRLLTMLIGKESIYAMEDPGFHRTRAVFKHENVKTISIPLDEEGISLKHLEESRANAVYITPSHQFPFGTIMPINRRLELLKWAEAKGRYIIEDDYDGEFRYIGKPIPSLQGLDFKDSVIYLGTFSKSLIPSIRLSYAVLPTALVNQYDQHLTIYKQTVSRLHQHTLFLFMKNGHWKSHLNKMRNVYRKKQHMLVASIKKYIGNKATIIGEKSGLHILLQVHNQMSELELIKNALKKKVKIYPTSIYYEQYKADKPMVLLGFGGLSETEIDEGIKLLKDAWFNEKDENTVQSMNDADQ
ncbi:PLP-dependent aminotransferase family protein [Bacillus aquiflavi]|uniref:PLP-dependent aminotransferase family protein n=1 Tax=Bacillus aquiflavi TaxID=2672567 RepID=A0A6B3VYZ1_9BACI|nr:PLP-dependent aminotransferase family protein [Bacillus aquiflavi]MBA4538148.1 PLP-dependent aminotransferase family protein [Bacillus aquiflavi]NEY82468.1 PLP-dependent aminotransferase family protein [Bacillus aquiflavi]UAC48560.1 PLP-dependent aminotransferase family protein [Bacillus aquiflavi]